MILLAIDTAFFFLELIVGYAVHSLALVADSFHMVCSSRYMLERVLTVSTAERCHIPPRRTVGSQGRESKDELKDIHIWSKCTAGSSHGYALTTGSGNAQRHWVLSSTASSSSPSASPSFSKPSSDSSSRKRSRIPKSFSSLARSVLPQTSSASSFSTTTDTAATHMEDTTSIRRLRKDIRMASMRMTTLLQMRGAT